MRKACREWQGVNATYRVSLTHPVKLQVKTGTNENL
jgi:hypothetical protein